LQSPDRSVVMVSPNARRWMFQLRSLEFECMDHIPSIGSIMTPFPYVVQVDESVLAARALMVEHQVRHLPVKDVTHCSAC
jgi:CBS domain-containing protein